MGVSTDDVAMGDLRCPTCGHSFDPTVGYEREEADYSDFLHPRDHVLGVVRPFLLCEEGHRWTIKRYTSTTSTEPPYEAVRDDEVLLGEYLGAA